MSDFTELENIYNAYKDAETFIERADAKIKELESKFGNKDVIQSVHKHNELLKVVTSTLAGFFEEMEQEGTGDYQEVIPLKDLEKYTEGIFLIG